MNKNQKTLLDSFLDSINKEYYDIFLDLAQYAVSLGYTPRRNKTQNFSIDFRKNKFKTSIMKMEVLEQKKGKCCIPGLRLKFYASSDYSQVFRDGIRNVIEEFGGKYTGCYGCGRCNNKLEGYTYVYPDGKKVFRCGRELISIFDFSADDLKEIKDLIKRQDEFFSTRYGKL